MSQFGLPTSDQTYASTILIMSSISFVKAVNYNDAQFITLKSSDEVPLQITTEAIKVYNFDRSAQGLTFPITRKMSESLHKNVSDLESNLIDAVLSMENGLFTNLPFNCQKTINECNVAQIANVLCPNYFTNSLEPTIYLKGLNNAWLPIYDWTGSSVISHTELGPGEYQFIIKADKAYFGPHKQLTHAFNLQLRIRQIRYRSFTQASIPQSKPIDIPKSKRAKRACKKPEFLRSSALDDLSFLDLSPLTTTDD